MLLIYLIFTTKIKQIFLTFHNDNNIDTQLIDTKCVYYITIISEVDRLYFAKHFRMLCPKCCSSLFVLFNFIYKSVLWRRNAHLGYSILICVSTWSMIFQNAMNCVYSWKSFVYWHNVVNLSNEHVEK